MINNIIEVWYWSFLLAALIGVVIYFSFGFVKDLWAAFKEQRAGGQAPLSKEKITEPYSKRMVIIHWLTLLLLIVAWYLGDALIDARIEKNATLIGYFAHALMGGAILLLTILRMTFRGVDGTPPPLGNSVMDIVARGVHHGLYVLLILLSITGFMTLLTSTVLGDGYSGQGCSSRALCLADTVVDNRVHDAADEHCGYGSGDKHSNPAPG